MAEINLNVSPDYTNIGIPDKSEPIRQKMRKVPQLLRQEKKNQQEYDPMVVSIGPYHHGKEELQLAEDFKIKCLELFVADSGIDEESLYDIVRGRVNDWRNCYIHVPKSRYDDQKFAQMMLLDACFIINYVLTDQYKRNHIDTVNCLGHLFLPLIQRDLFLLENQIPFRLLEKLIFEGYGQKRGKEMLCIYFNSTLYGDYKPNGIASSTIYGDSNPNGIAFHLLDAYRLMLVPPTTPEQPNKLGKIKEICTSLLENIAIFPSRWCKLRRSTTRKDQEEVGSAPRKPPSCIKSLPPPDKHHVEEEHWLRSAPKKPEHYIELQDEKYTAKKWVHSFRSASELKSRGIHLRPSKEKSLRSIKFYPGIFSATLELPVWFVSMDNKVFFLNMIAYELCPGASTDQVVTAYIELMKKLIDNPNDVKELREQGILLITSGNDEDVVKVYKELNTYGIHSVEEFQKTKEDIQHHYGSKGKTWLAELIYVYFRTPWTVITLLAATVLLILTFLQTYFTIHPR